jgi:hypothetical protein
MHEEGEGPQILFVEPEPRRDLLSQAPPHLAMILLLALSQIVKQYG